MTNNTILDSPALGARKESRREDEDGLVELALMSVHEEVGNDDNESRMWRRDHPEEYGSTKVKFTVVCGYCDTQAPMGIGKCVTKIDFQYKAVR